MNNSVVIIIPAYNEENSIQKVIRDIPRHLVSEIVVVNNNSSDATEINALEAGATVLIEREKGYGAACLKGIGYVAGKIDKPGIIVFIDADYSDHPEQLPELIRPIAENNFDMVIGSRALGNRSKGSMTPQQLVGNKLATTLIRWFYKVHYTDLGPFRAIRYSSLIRMDMKDRNYGWTVEMQLKAAKQKMKVCEIPVDYRERIGFSKISGTFKGTLGAGYKIITTIFRYL